MLTSAIEGISKGFMNYENDPVLPIVKNSIKKRVEEFNGLTAE